MLFYKVNPENDNKIIKGSKHYDIYIANELYTEKEIERMERKGWAFNKDYCTPVEVSKNKTYWLFGARFACGEDKYYVHK